MNSLDYKKKREKMKIEPTPINDNTNNKRPEFTNTELLEALVHLLPDQTKQNTLQRIGGIAQNYEQRSIKRKVDSSNQSTTANRSLKKRKTP